MLLINLLNLPTEDEWRLKKSICFGDGSGGGGSSGGDEGGTGGGTSGDAGGGPGGGGGDPGGGGTTGGDFGGQAGSTAGDFGGPADTGSQSGSVDAGGFGQGVGGDAGQDQGGSFGADFGAADFGAPADFGASFGTPADFGVADFGSPSEEGFGTEAAGIGLSGPIGGAMGTEEGMSANAAGLGLGLGLGLGQSTPAAPAQSSVTQGVIGVMSAPGAAQQDLGSLSAQLGQVGVDISPAAMASTQGFEQALAAQGVSLSELAQVGMENVSDPQVGPAVPTRQGDFMQAPGASVEFMQAPGQPGTEQVGDIASGGLPSGDIASTAGGAPVTSDVIQAGGDQFAGMSQASDLQPTSLGASLNDTMAQSFGMDTGTQLAAADPGITSDAVGGVGSQQFAGASGEDISPITPSEREASAKETAAAAQGTEPTTVQLDPVTVSAEKETPVTGGQEGTGDEESAKQASNDAALTSPEKQEGDRQAAESTPARESENVVAAHDEQQTLPVQGEGVERQASLGAGSLPPQSGGPFPTVEQFQLLNPGFELEPPSPMPEEPPVVPDPGRDFAQNAGVQLTGSIPTEGGFDSPVFNETLGGWENNPEANKGFMPDPTGIVEPPNFSPPPPAESLPTEDIFHSPSQSAALTSDTEPSLEEQLGSQDIGNIPPGQQEQMKDEQALSEGLPDEEQQDEEARAFGITEAEARTRQPGGNYPDGTPRIPSQNQDQARAARAATESNPLITWYSPGQGNLKMEGGNYSPWSSATKAEQAQGKGEGYLSDVQMYLNGQTPYVSTAGSPETMGRTGTMDLVDPSTGNILAEGVPFVQEDTGSAFVNQNSRTGESGTPYHMDVANRGATVNAQNVTFDQTPQNYGQESGKIQIYAETHGGPISLPAADGSQLPFLDARDMGMPRSDKTFDPQGLMVHYTENPNLTAQSLADVERARGGGLGVQAAIDRDGTLIVYMPPEVQTGHAGKLEKGEVGGFPNNQTGNDKLTGVELIASHGNDVTDAMKQTLSDYYNSLSNKFSWDPTTTQVFGHGELASHKQQTYPDAQNNPNNLPIGSLDNMPEGARIAQALREGSLPVPTAMREGTQTQTATREQAPPMLPITPAAQVAQPPPTSSPEAEAAILDALGGVNQPQGVANLTSTPEAEAALLDALVGGPTQTVGPAPMDVLMPGQEGPASGGWSIDAGGFEPGQSLMAGQEAPGFDPFANTDFENPSGDVVPEPAPAPAPYPGEERARNVYESPAEFPNLPSWEEMLRSIEPNPLSPGSQIIAPPPEVERAPLETIPSISGWDPYEQMAGTKGEFPVVSTVTRGEPGPPNPVTSVYPGESLAPPMDVPARSDMTGVLAAPSAGAVTNEPLQDIFDPYQFPGGGHDVAYDQTGWQFPGGGRDALYDEQAVPMDITGTPFETQNVLGPPMETAERPGVTGAQDFMTEQEQQQQEEEQQQQEEQEAIPLPSVEPRTSVRAEKVFDTVQKEARDRMTAGQRAEADKYAIHPPTSADKAALAMGRMSPIEFAAKISGYPASVIQGAMSMPFGVGTRTTQGIQALTANVAEMQQAMGAGKQTAAVSAAATEARMADMASRGIDEDTGPASQVGEPPSSMSPGEMFTTQNMMQFPQMGWTPPLGPPPATTQIPPGTIAPAPSTTSPAEPGTPAPSAPEAPAAIVGGVPLSTDQIIADISYGSGVLGQEAIQQIRQKALRGDPTAQSQLNEIQQGLRIG